MQLLHKRLAVVAVLFFSAVSLISCHSKNNIPDVSGIKVKLGVRRFEQAFFSLDTNNIIPQTDRLIASYPSFGENFLSTILGIDPKWPSDTTAFYLKGFMIYNRTVYDSAEALFKDFTPYQNRVTRALQFVKYYFPQYKIPTQIITYIGPADGYGDILDDNALIIGLHAHLGKDFPLYKTSAVEDTYPEYVTANFTPQTIPVNCMKNIVLDIYPEKADDKRLIIQMIEKGKRLYLLSKLLPETPENLLIGYSTRQMQDCYAHETAIWNLFIQNNYLQLADNDMTKNYITDGPKTPELGEGAPGNIGSFAGWQIVKKYLNKNPQVKPDSLMRTNDEALYEAAKYKP